MTVSSFQLFNVIKQRMGEADAQALVEFIENKVHDEVQEKAETLATKEDISKIRVDMSEMKAELLKWMFIYWTGTIVTLAGIVVAILKLFPGK